MLQNKPEFSTKYPQAFKELKSLAQFNFTVMTVTYALLNVFLPDITLGESTMANFNLIFSKTGTYWYATALILLSAIYAIGAITRAVTKRKYTEMADKSIGWTLQALLKALKLLCLPICVALVTAIHAPIVSRTAVLSVVVICIWYLSLSVMVVYAQHLPRLRQ